MDRLALTGGMVYVDGKLRQLDVICASEKVVALLDHGSALLPEDIRRVELAGAWVLPGLIDTHVHFREPGYEHKETIETGSRAAAAGGVTMFVDMPNLIPPTNTAERFAEHRELAETKSYVDFNHWALPLILDEIPSIASEGAVGFKFFQKEAAYPYDQGVAIRHHGRMLEALRTIAPTGLPCVVHTHNQDIWEYKTSAWLESGKTDDRPAWREVSYGDRCISQTTGTALVVLMAEATGCKLRVCHVQSLGQMKLSRALRSGGYDFVTEFNPTAVFDVEPMAKRGEGDVEANWEGLADGTIDLIASDHAPHTREEDEAAARSSFDSVVRHLPWTEHYGALFLDAVLKGKLSLKRFVDLTSTFPARHLGVYPRKGTIAIGSDADLAVFEVGSSYVIGKDLAVYSKTGYSPMEGTTLAVRPTHTLVRGRLVFQKGSFPTGPGYGRFVRPNGS